MASFTHHFRTIEEVEERNNTVAPATEAGSEPQQFEMDDWINKDTAKAYETENAGDLEGAYQRLCSEIEVAKTPTVISTDSAETEDLLIAELGLQPDPAPSISLITEDLIAELGKQIEGCAFTTNLVELMNPEESFELDDDWPVPKDDDDDLEGSDFDFDDDYYYSMLEGMKEVNLCSDDGTLRSGDDDEESAAAYPGCKDELINEPILVEGEWQTFELQDSDMSEPDEESEGSKIIDRMIQNSRERRARLIKVAQAQRDVRLAHEFELSQALSKDKGVPYDVNTVALNDDVDMKELSPSPGSQNYLTTKIDVSGGFEQVKVSKDCLDTSSPPRFKSCLERLHLSSSSGRDNWTAPSSDETNLRNRKSGRPKKEDLRTLRELREDLNSLLFDVSSVNLETQTSRSGKGTPLIARSGKETPLVIN
ncbi:hypothetical protein P7C70_g9431, partial [Phenoliferia sp. Uapishka_3]